MEIKKFKKIMQYLLVAVIGLFIIGSIFDWQISSVLAGKLNWYGRFFEVFGLWPLTIVRAAVLIYFVYIIENEKKLITWILKTPFIYFAIKVIYTGLLTTFIMISYEFSGEYTINAGTSVVASIVLAVVIFICGLLYIKRFERQELRSLSKRMIMIYICTIVVNHEVEFIKTHVGRARYYTVVANNGDYTPWYHINGLTDNNDFMSFISGHTTSGYMAVLLGFMFTAKNQLLARKFYLSGFAFGLLVALSRIVLGQHYVTDTMGSIIIMSATIYYLMKLFNIQIDGSDLKESQVEFFDN